MDLRQANLVKYKHNQFSALVADQLGFLPKDMFIILIVGIMLF